MPGRQSGNAQADQGCTLARTYLVGFRRPIVDVDAELRGTVAGAIRAHAEETEDDPEECRRYAARCERAAFAEESWFSRFSRTLDDTVNGKIKREAGVLFLHHKVTGRSAVGQVAVGDVLVIEAAVGDADFEPERAGLRVILLYVCTRLLKQRDADIAKGFRSTLEWARTESAG